jgi:rfaE bifunctional protein nucleotidyltransferase chain/domain
MSLSTVQQVIAATRGQRTVFTNGVFDVLHAGHVDVLERARALGDCLIVGINTDESVRTLGKGPDRPINPLEDRARVVGALRCVEFVVSFGERTPERLLAELKPSVHVKGGDYVADGLPEAPVVRAYGGEIVILPLLPGRSTTGILERIRSHSPD